MARLRDVLLDQWFLTLAECPFITSRSERAAFLSLSQQFVVGIAVACVFLGHGAVAKAVSAVV